MAKGKRWQKVYNVWPEGHISLNNLYKFSHIYKCKYPYLKPKNLKSKLISRKKQTEKKKKSFPLRQCRVGPMLSSVFWNENTDLSEIFYFNISESQTFSKYYYYQANISNLSAWYIPPSASVQTCKPMIDNTLIVKLLYRCWSHLFQKLF